jgi:hypothetical protein
MGTVVSAGTGRGVVVATGRQAQFGRIALGLGERQSETEFQVGLRRFLDVAGQLMKSPCCSPPPSSCLVWRWLGPLAALDRGCRDHRWNRPGCDLVPPDHRSQPDAAWPEPSRGLAAGRPAPDAASDRSWVGAVRVGSRSYSPARVGDPVESSTLRRR